MVSSKQLEKPTRASLKRKGAAVASLEPEQMRAYLLTKPISRGGRLWCDRVLEGVDERDRTCMRLFGEAMKWTGATGAIGDLIRELGARTMDEAKRLADSGRKLEQLQSQGIPLEELRDESLEALRMVLQQHPEWRSEVLSRLGSHAVEVHENGGNGNGTG